MFPFRGAPRRVSADEARHRTLGPAAPAVLVDVRERAEWDAGHVPGAVHAALSRLVAGAALPGAAQGRPVVVICRSGHRSQQAARLLADRGVDAVDVKGGMKAWAAAGHAVAGPHGTTGTVA
ncbi:rhodanese-like domain-containing protein [Streptomyces sp. NRRL F-5123]|uniref:rhodanese-like domain-containing protein n=1 Tax=Streptomyces sp. NRRL F-5123 TaxID=1463856 RepID=UPI0004E0CD72|nr:rhodanese-like domain-containing protein [Streptomyces sp. NRRL F-5123]